MPDITMCTNIKCRNKKHCLRSKSSGTIPDMRQSYSDFDDISDSDGCEYFINVTNL